MATDMFTNPFINATGVKATYIPGIDTSNIGSSNIGPATGFIMPDMSKYEIRGEMFTVQLTEHDMFKSGIVDNGQFDDLIKHDLINKLVNALMKSNNIEFTKQIDSKNFSTVYRARIFAVPDTQVQLIRTILK